MEREWNIGIVGFGERGSHFADVYSKIPGVRVVGVADPVPRLREQAFALYGCELFEDVEDMVGFANGPIDILIVATHVPYHFDHVMTGLARRCQVVCEKPMACTLAECDEMIRFANEQWLTLAVHHQSIFSRATTEVKRRIADREIGDLVRMAAYGKGRVACSDLMEIAGHLTHWMRHVSGGEVTEVFGDVTLKGRPVTLEDVVRIKDIYPEGRDSGWGAGDRMFGYYKFSNGVRTELHLDQVSGAPSTFGEQRVFGYYVDVFGTRGRLRCYLPRVLYSNASPLDDRAYNPTEWVEVDASYREDREPVLSRLLAQDFLAAIEENRKPLVSGEDGRMAMGMTLGIYHSHFAGRPLPIPDRGHPFGPAFDNR